MASANFNTYTYSQQYPQAYPNTGFTAPATAFTAEASPSSGTTAAATPQYPIHYQPAAKESFPPSPEVPVNDAKRFSQQCTEAARAAEKLDRLQKISEEAQKNLKEVENKLHKFGVERPEFKPKHTKPIVITSKTIEEGKKEVDDLTKEVEKDVKDTYRAEFRAEKAIEEEVHVEQKYNRTVNGQHYQNKLPNGNFKPQNNRPNGNHHFHQHSHYQKPHNHHHQHQPHYQKTYQHQHQPYHYNYKHLNKGSNDAENIMLGTAIAVGTIAVFSLHITLPVSFAVVAGLGVYAVLKA